MRAERGYVHKEKETDKRTDEMKMKKEQCQTRKEIGQIGRMTFQRMFSGRIQCHRLKDIVTMSK
jgi:hypothetical protein